MMNSKSLLLILRAGISAGLLAWLAWILDWQAVKALQPSVVLYLGAGALIFLASLCFMAFRWKLILDHEIEQHVSFLLLLRFYVIAQFFNIFMPGAIGGDTVRATYANLEFKTGLKRIVAVIFSERIFGLTSIFMLIALGFFFNPFVMEKIGLTVESSLLLGVLAIASLFTAKYLATKETDVTWPMAFALLLVSVIPHIGEVFLTWILISYFGADIRFVDLLLVVPTVFIATILPISIGGIGVREGTMAGLLGLFGVDSSIAILTAFSLYLTRIIVGCAGGILYTKGKKPAELPGGHTEDGEVT